jgi:hypothetical protein
MAAIGEPIFRTVSLSGKSSDTIFAPAGESQKINMVYAKAQSDGTPQNDLFFAAPAAGVESGRTQGSSTGSQEAPPIGSNAEQGIQPVVIDDQNGLYLGNDDQNAAVVVVRGIRVA